MLNELKILIDIFGIITGVISVVFLSITLINGPPLIKPALTQFIIGSVFIGLAFLSNIILEMKIITYQLPVGPHRLLLAIAAVFFVNSARLFYKIGR